MTIFKFSKYLCL